ncbi:MAG: HTTM domain-containing protein [Gemmataceae bacterium]
MTSTPSASGKADTSAIPVREFFTLDVRSLALFRVALAVLIILDWIDRLPDLRVLFSDDGMMPRNLVQGLQPFSFHMLSGSVWFQALLFAIAIGLGVLLLIGWRAPWVCLVSFFLLASIHGRNPTLMQGGDHLIRIITFWGIFLPLGACWSVDASRPGTKPASSRILSPATVAYVFQICMVYWFAAAWKWLGPWRDEGTAVYLTLHIGHLPTRLGYLLREFPSICWFLTHYTIYLEAFGPVLLLLPFNVPLQRLVAISLFILFHAGLALMMELGHFPFVCMVAWLPLIPGAFWDRLVPRLQSPDAARLTLLMDPDRPRTARRLAYLRSFLFLDQIALAGAEASHLDVVRAQGGWLLREADGQERSGPDALARLVALSPLWFPLASWMQGSLGSWLTRWLGRHGGAASPPLSPPGWTPPGGLVGNTVVLFCLIYLATCNLVNFVSTQIRDQMPDLARRILPLIPDQVGQFGAAVGIEQGWGLFAPEPGRQAGWFIVVGYCKNGDEVDAYNGGPLSWERPEFQTLTYESGRWRKMRMNLGAVRAYPYLLPGFTRFYFTEWNRKHEGDEQLRSLEVYWMREITAPPGVTPPPPEKLLLYRYDPSVALPPPPGELMAIGTRRDGSRIDLFRGGLPLERDEADPRPDAPIVSPVYAMLVSASRPETARYVLPGYARYLFDDWNRQHREEEHVMRVELLRVRPASEGRPADRELLARYDQEARQK